MTDPDRGAYTPQTDAPLAFDARQGRGGGRSPVVLVMSGFVLAVLVAGVAVLYHGGVRGKNEPPRPVGTPVGPMKTVAPPQPPAVDQTASLQVYKSGEAPAAAPAAADPRLADRRDRGARLRQSICRPKPWPDDPCVR